MKLYDCAMAPNPRRVRIFLAEKKLKIDIEQVNILEGENLSSRYLSVNRWGFVPTLELDNGTYTAGKPAIKFSAIVDAPALHITNVAFLSFLCMSEKYVFTSELTLFFR